MAEFPTNQRRAGNVLIVIKVQLVEIYVIDLERGTIIV